MRYMIMHKTSAYWEAGGLPAQELIDRVGKMIGEMVESGALLAADGLRPSSLGVRLRFAGGERTVTKGPFNGANGEPGGFAILKVKSMEEAIECAARFAELIGDVEMDIRPVTESWDIGAGEKPAGLSTIRVMATHTAGQASEALPPPTPQLMAAMGKLIGELTQSGVLQSTEGFPSPSMWTRLKAADGRYIITDGPFVESKELIGGFVILKVESRDEALRWLRRYADAVGAREIDLIPLPEFG